MRPSRGFTLLEVLLGLALTVLLLALLFSALRLAQRSEARGRKMQEASQRLRATAEYVAWLLRGAYPYMTEKEGQSLVVFEGKGDSLVFITSSTLRYGAALQDEPGLKLVRLWSDEEGLKMAEGLFFMTEEELQEYVLDEAVGGLELGYLQGTEEGPRWASEWDPQEGKLPLAVRFRFVLQGQGRLSWVVVKLRTAEPPTGPWQEAPGGERGEGLSPP
jgi:type II secretory pathway component PulJ